MYFCVVLIYKKKCQHKFATTVTRERSDPAKREKKPSIDVVNIVFHNTCVNLQIMIFEIIRNHHE